MAKKIPEKNEDDVTSMYRYSFNTPIPPSLQESFGKWIIEEGSKKGKDILEDMDDYDVQGYWLKEKDKNSDHWPDKYKKPNHPTFSSESIYNDNVFQGGKWSEDGDKKTFTVGKQNLQNMSQMELKIYFDTYEKDTSLVIPDELKGEKSE
jgi:hypothetical protein